MKRTFNDLDERGLAKRDKIEGDSLTLVSFDKKKRRRVSLALYLTGEFPTAQFRRTMGWIQPSLDGDPPHPIVLASLLSSQDKARKKAETKAANIEKQEAARVAKQAKKEAKHAEWLARKAAASS
jgi:hypothetical protein